MIFWITQLVSRLRSSHNSILRCLSEFTISQIYSTWCANCWCFDAENCQTPIRHIRATELAGKVSTQTLTAAAAAGHILWGNSQLTVGHPASPTGTHESQMKNWRSSFHLEFSARWAGSGISWLGYSLSFGSTEIIKNDFFALKDSDI